MVVQCIRSKGQFQLLLAAGACLLAMLAVGATGVAYGAVPSAAHAEKVLDKNLCDSATDEWRNAPDARTYATTGIPPKGWKPKHSRAWYLAGLGMTTELGKLEDEGTIQLSSDLLISAIVSGESRVVAYLLSSGVDPNRPESGYPHQWPLRTAVVCRRATATIYLLEAGADLYAAQGDNALAMGDAVVGGWHVGPDVRLIKILLAAGFDPRCPIASNGETSLDIVDKLAKENPTGQSAARNQELKDILQSAIKIENRRHPGRPHCGGLNWWRS